MIESFWIKRVRKLVKLSTFEAAIFTKLQLVPSHKISTVGMVNGTVYLNPCFIGKLTNEQVNAVLKHELYHHYIMAKARKV